ncbi:MAG: hypothetical protein WCJ18_02315 [Planctomycetota bacterium]
MKPTNSDDAEVETEFKRIEHERIAQERAEAREDVESTAPEKSAHRPRQWQVTALALALAVGLVAALFANRWQPAADPKAPPPAKNSNDR